MPLWSTTIAIMFLAAVATGVAISRHGRPGPKRQWLFESADGERVNPFSDLTVGAAARDECTECGATLESLSEEFCVTCGRTVVADD